MEIKWVYFNNQPWSTSSEVLEKLNIVPRQHVTSEQIRQIVKENLAECEKALELSKNEKISKE